MTKWKSKYVSVNLEDIDAVGMCDISGFMFNRKDMHKQMEWRGDSLAWNGLIVGAPFLDEPNGALRPPPIDTDPKPVKNPRPPFPYLDPESPQAGTYTQMRNDLDENSFHNSDDVILVSADSFQGLSYSRILAQLRRVTFQ